MSKNGLDLTVAGTVGGEVRIYHKDDGGTPFAMFRMVHTPRVRTAEGWRDGIAQWFTVKVFRQSALNAALSLRSGDAVLVHGRLSTEEWADAGGNHFTVVLVATSFGHDLTRGVARFRRVTNPRPAGESAGSGERGPSPAEQPDPLDVTDFPEAPDAPAEDEDDAFDEDDEQDEGVGRSALVGAF